jgi:broad specificity phosphatase PhoE
MKFVLFRHASKAIMPFEDPELTPQGFQQSLQIVNLIKNGVLPIPTDLFVSPKRRASQTFYPLSKEFGLTMKIKPELDLRRHEETSKQFRERISDFLKTLESENADKVIFACSHMDWIEESMTLIDCDKNLNSFEFSHWAPTQFLSFDVQNSQWTVLKKGDAK